MLNTFLFDNQNTGQIPFSKGKNKLPELVWKTRLPGYPVYGPESTCVIDNHGRIYFGSHNGIFYCLSKNGKIKWSFPTGGMIYSSPAITNKGQIVFGSANGRLYSVDAKGEYKWSYNVSGNIRKLQARTIAGKLHKNINDLYNKFREQLITLEHSEGNYRAISKSRITSIWASPKVLANDTVLISGVGEGLMAINGDNGKLLWKYNLGKPYYHIAGPAVDKQENIYIPSKLRHFHCIDSSGSLKWSHDSGSKYHAWAAPSIDEENGLVFYSRSLKEKKSIVYALDLTGKLIWQKKIDAAVRGSATISRLNYIIVGDFNGNLNFLNKLTGELLNSVKLTNTDRGLWTTASIDLTNHIFITTKKNRYSGKVCCLNKTGKIVWQYKTGKSLSTPVLDKQGRLYFGNWNGEYICLQT